MSPALLLLAAVHAAPQAELLDFTATWCGPCQQMGPIVSQLQREGYPIRQVDVDRHQDLARRYGITSIPAFVLVVDGREAGRIVGAKGEVALRQLLAKIPAPAPDRDAAAEPAPKKSGFRWPFGGNREPESPEPPSFPQEPVVKRGQTPPPAPVPETAVAAAPRAAHDPIESAVRIRVKDPRGVDYGSGTVIGSREGKALVLTCYHIFREFGKDAEVEIDLFPAGPQADPQTYPGKLVDADQEADVALVAVDGCGLVAVSPLVAAGRFPQKGDHVFSVGCGNGEPPSKLQHTVTRINPYQGPDATECTEMPVVGRSGGGLFDRQGCIVGVCFAAARETKTGVYVGPAEIHRLMHKAGYAALVPAAGTPFVQTDSPAEPDGQAFTPDESELGPFADHTGQEEPTAPIAPTGEPRPQFEPDGGDYAGAIAALESGAEVICTIRPLSPGGQTEVVVINKASARFLRYLRGELDGKPVETSMRVPSSPGRRRQDAAPDPAAGPSRKPYVRLAAAHVPTAGVALLSRVFHNHGRF